MTDQNMIDSRAIIDPKARLAPDVKVGPWTFIGADVEIGAGSHIGPHVVLKGPTKIGKNNKIYQFASVGEDPQDKKYGGEPTVLEIGDNNIIREFCTFNRGTSQGGGVTKIGNNNLFMAYVHIAHDCIVGNNTIFANNASISGHVVVHDHAILSGFAVIHQYCHIGSYSFIAGATPLGKDVLPYVLVCGPEAKVYGLNTEGLKRHGFTAEKLNQLRRAYKIIFRSGLTVQQAQEQLLEMVAETPEVQLLIDALKESVRGIVR